MPTVLRFPAPRQVEVATVERQPLAPGEVRLRTLYSGISAGTELTDYRGTNPYRNRRWQPDNRLFLDAGDAPPAYPLEGFGYEEVGEVSELGPGVSGVEPGQLVWGSWGHRSEAVLAADIARDRLLPDGADPLLGIFARIGAIGLNAAHDAQIHLGETVAVFGMGVPGLIALQCARLNGARTIAVDGLERRLALARELGADEVLDIREGSPAERVKAITAGRGADSCIEISGNYAALAEAVRAVAYNSRVAAAGFYQGEGAALRLGEEFHHNRVQVVCSQISGVSTALDHRWDRLRLERTVMGLAAAGRLALLPLVTHLLPVRDAAEAYRMLDERPGEYVQVVLDYRAGAGA